MHLGHNGFYTTHHTPLGEGLAGTAATAATMQTYHGAGCAVENWVICFNECGLASCPRLTKRLAINLHLHKPFANIPHEVGVGVGVWKLKLGLGPRKCHHTGLDY